MPDYDPKTDRVLKDTSDFDPTDYVRLALACLDQAGLPWPDLDDLTVTVAEELDIAFDDINITYVLAHKETS